MTGGWALVVVWSWGTMGTGAGVGSVAVGRNPMAGDLARTAATAAGDLAATAAGDLAAVTAGDLAELFAGALSELFAGDLAGVPTL